MLWWMAIMLEEHHTIQADNWTFLIRSSFSAKSSKLFMQIIPGFLYSAKFLKSLCGARIKLSNNNTNRSTTIIIIIICRELWIEASQNSPDNTLFSIIWHLWTSQNEDFCSLKGSSLVLVLPSPIFLAVPTKFGTVLLLLLLLLSNGHNLTGEYQMSSTNSWFICNKVNLNKSEFIRPALPGFWTKRSPPLNV